MKISLMIVALGLATGLPPGSNALAQHTGPATTAMPDLQPPQPPQPPLPPGPAPAQRRPPRVRRSLNG
jgi:hypothetical protein